MCKCKIYINLEGVFQFSFVKTNFIWLEKYNFNGLINVLNIIYDNSLCISYINFLYMRFLFIYNTLCIFFFFCYL